jgi:hypothetical protein
MECPNCKKPFLKVTHTYQAGPGCVSQRRKCAACKGICTSVVLVVYDDGSHGGGAKAIAERMKKDPTSVGSLLSRPEGSDGLGG